MDGVPQPAFDRLEPVPELYATLPIDQAFDWDACAEPETAGEWYLVCFRSVRDPAADEALLARLDDAAHEEAATSPGFVHYFKGATTSTGNCMSFCLWHSRALAREAAGRPLHTRATAVTGRMYASYRLEFYRVTKRRGSSHFEFAPYDGPSSLPTEHAHRSVPAA
jgi:hypothetical protein